MKKLLPVLVVILLLAIVAEISYLYVRARAKSDSNTGRQAPTTTSMVDSQIPFDAIAEALKNKERLIRSGQLKYSLVEDNYEFIIKYVADESELPDDFKRENPWKGLLYYDFEGESRGFMFNEDEANKLEVFTMQNKGMKQITLKDLEKGDRVRVKYVYNIFKAPAESAEKIEIIKL